MKLYKFDFRDYCNKGIKRSVLECEEKPKTFISKDSGFRSRIPKDEIGVVQSWAGLYVLLLEDDFEKAKSIYLDYFSSKIISENIRYEQQIDSYNKIIEVIKESKE